MQDLWLPWRQAFKAYHAGHCGCKHYWEHLKEPWSMHAGDPGDGVHGSGGGGPSGGGDGVEGLLAAAAFLEDESREGPEGEDCKQ